MPYFCTLVVAIALCNISATAQWKKVEIDPPTYLDITGIHIANQSVVIAAALLIDSLIIVRSIDKGESFTISYHSPKRRGFTSITGIRTITSVNDSMVFAAGENVFLVSKDTGRSWVDGYASLPDSIVASLELPWVLFSSTSYRGAYTLISGNVRESVPLMLKYLPGSNTWQVLNAQLSFEGMVAVSESRIYAHLEEGNVYISNDTGASFVVTTESRAFDISFTDTSAGNVAGGLFYSSTRDGGLSWTSKRVCRFGCSSIVFVDTLRGWTGSSQELHRTTDGGRNWQDQSQWIARPGKNWDASHLAAIDSNVVFFGGRDGLFVTFNGGVDTTSTSVAENQPGRALASLRLSPNPASDQFRVTISGPVTGRLTVTDLTGNVVYECLIDARAAKVHDSNISTDQLARGVYQVLFHHTDGVLRESLVILR